MEIKIQAIHFDATEQLHAFIEKKVSKLEKTYEQVQKADVSLKVVKPATAMNKQASRKHRFCRKNLRHIRGKYRPMRRLFEGSTNENQGKTARALKKMRKNFVE